MPTGLIMTVGELASFTMIIAGAAQCIQNAADEGFPNQTVNCNGSLLAVGYIGYVGLRIWEIIDVWATPSSINQRYHNLKNHVEQSKTSFGVYPVIAKNSSFDGAALAFQLRF